MILLNFCLHAHLQGNALFKEGKYEAAINCYTTGIQFDPTNAVLPANRAMCLLKLKRLVFPLKRLFLLKLYEQMNCKVTVHKSVTREIIMMIMIIISMTPELVMMNLP